MEHPVRSLHIVGLATHDSLGGAQIALRKLMDALAARGHRTELWFLYRKGVEHEAGEAHLLLPKPAHGVAGYLRAVLALCRAMHDARPDALVTFLPLANIVGQAIAMLTGVPARVASHRNPVWTYEQPMLILDKIAGAIGIYGRIVCVSRNVLDSFSGHSAVYRRRLMVVPNGLELRPPDIHKMTARLTFGFAAEAFVVAAVGRLCPQKNLKFMLDVTARVPGIVLALAGHGEDRAMLEAHARMLGIRERVVFLGRISAQRVQELLASADIFVQPSLFEGQSNALLEAMAAGLPILASDIPSQRETLIDEAGRHCGILLPLGDPESWADALRQLQVDAKTRHSMGSAAAERSGAFTVADMATGFEVAITAAGTARGALHTRILMKLRTPRTARPSATAGKSGSRRIKEEAADPVTEAR